MLPKLDDERPAEASRGPRSEKPDEGAQQFPVSDAQPNELYDPKEIRHSIGLASDKPKSSGERGKRFERK